MLKQDANAL